MINLRVLHGEGEDNILVSELLVDVREGVQLGLHLPGVLGIQQHLELLGALEVASALADDLGGEDDVLDR